MICGRRLAQSLALCACVAFTSAAVAEERAVFSADIDVKGTPGWPDIDSAVRIAWYKRDFAGLEAEISRDPTIRAANGTSKQALAYKTIETILESEGSKHPEQSGKFKFIADWQKAFPNSAAPRLVKALMLVNYAIQNPDMAQRLDYPYSGYLPRASALEDAQHVLETAHGSAKRYPYSFAIALEIGVLKRQPFDVLYLIAEDERLAAPGYLEAARVLLTHLVESDHWAGPNLDSAVRSLSSAESSDVRTDDYARLYTGLYQRHPTRDFLDFADPKWPLLQTGFAKLANTFPTQRLYSQNAAISCLAGDRKASTAAFSKIKGQPIDEEVWKIGTFYRECRDWAVGEDK